MRVDAQGVKLEANYVRTFADVPEGELLVYEDAYRRLSVAVSHGSAAERLGTGAGDPVRIRTA
jgi:S-adenosylmethionine hydrolase